MSDIPSDLKYTAEHEWVRLVEGRARVGITAFAQEQLGDVVYVELPKAGSQVTGGKAMGVVESVKAASDIFCPLTGTVLAVNEALTDHPEQINSDPYGEGWLVEIAPAEPAELEALLDAVGYAQALEA